MSASCSHSSWPGADAAGDLTRLSPVSTATLRVGSIRHHAGDLVSLKLENSNHSIALDYPGRSAKLGLTTGGRTYWQNATISSSPTDSTLFELTVCASEMTCEQQARMSEVVVGDWVRVAGPQGEFFFDPDRHTEQLVLLTSDSAVCSVISIPRFLEAIGNHHQVRLIHFATPNREVPMYDVCRRLASRMPSFVYTVVSKLSQPGWRLEHLEEMADELEGCRFFVDGAPSFVDSCCEWLAARSVPKESIHLRPEMNSVRD